MVILLHSDEKMEHLIQLCAMCSIRVSEDKNIGIVFNSDKLTV